MCVYGSKNSCALQNSGFTSTSVFQRSNISVVSETASNFAHSANKKVLRVTLNDLLVLNGNHTLLRVSLTGYFEKSHFRYV